MSRVQALFSFVAENHPRSLKGLEESRAVAPALFDEVAEKFLGWAAKVHGDDGYLPRCVDAFAMFSHDVLMSQARYEADGHYENDSFAKCEEAVYGRREVMDDYLWGVFLTNFMWAHHMDITRFYKERFISKLPAAPKVVELAPGHGGWGVWMLSERPDATLHGYDVSPSSIVIASSVAEAAGVNHRVQYTRRNALDLESMPAGEADAVICSFLIEHLEEPWRLVAVISRLLKPGGRAFLTGALTAAQVDHIYEFRRESELVLLCEQHDLRVLETISVAPQRLLPKARFLPRSMGLLLQRRKSDMW
ncbi:MAG TPA: class I SAM-dependent methyltransferase [Myxococcota bacterium]|nr:class I SAM-dependent methyltransferase [Myxococcota bacterium]HNH47879.1 class I SAM-dependent methyltransferase [Myxococcota bacterium]